MSNFEALPTFSSPVANPKEISSFMARSGLVHEPLSRMKGLYKSDDFKLDEDAVLLPGQKKLVRVVFNPNCYPLSEIHPLVADYFEFSGRSRNAQHGITPTVDGGKQLARSFEYVERPVALFPEFAKKYKLQGDIPVLKADIPFCNFAGVTLGIPKNAGGGRFFVERGVQLKGRELVSAVQTTQRRYNPDKLYISGEYNKHWRWVYAEGSAKTEDDVVAIALRLGKKKEWIPITQRQKDPIFPDLSLEAGKHGRVGASKHLVTAPDTRDYILTLRRTSFTHLGENLEAVLSEDVYIDPDSSRPDTYSKQIPSKLIDRDSRHEIVWEIYGPTSREVLPRWGIMTLYKQDRPESIQFAHPDTFRRWPLVVA